jgi:hypothetical protein
MYRNVVNSLKLCVTEEEEEDSDADEEEVKTETVQEDVVERSTAYCNPENDVNTVGFVSEC